MPDGLTTLPNFANNEGANTAVLLQNDSTVGTYLGIAQQRLNDRIFNYKQKQDEIERQAAALNFDEGEVWQQDFEPIHNKIGEFRDWVFKNPDATTPSSPLYKDYKQNQEEINYLIHKSKYDKEQYSGTLKMISDHPELATPENYARLKLHKDAPLDKRQFGGLDVSVEDNPIADAKSLEELLAKGNPQIKMTPTGYGYVKETTTTPIDSQYVEKGIKAQYDNSWQKRQNAEAAFQKLTPEQRKAENINSPFDVFRHSRIELMNLSPEVKSELKGIQYAPEWMSKTDKESGGIDYIATAAQSLSNPDSGIWTDNITYENGKVAGKGTNVFNDLSIPAGTDENGKAVYSPISGFRRVDGKLYAVPKIFANSQKKTIANKDLIEISDVRNQVLIPYLNQNLANSPNGQTLIQDQLDKYDANQKKSATQPAKTLSLKELKSQYDFSGMTDDQIRQFYKDKNIKLTD